MSHPNTETGKKVDVERLFLALWPDSTLQERLAGLLQNKNLDRRQRPVRRDHIHLTLLFLGNLLPRQRDELAAGCARIKSPPFSIALDTLGYWRGPAVCWIGASTVPEPLNRLVMALRQLAMEVGIETDRRAYAPHITLARKIRRRPADWEYSGDPLIWDVDHFVLVRSVTHPEGVEYERLMHWPLYGDGSR